MKRETLPFTDKETWLSYRVDDITSTMMPALFGFSPYTTLFELYHAKHSGVEVPFRENERMRQGSNMEDYIAREYAYREGVEVQPYKDYIRLTDKRIGSSFDYITADKKKLIEIKAVDYLVWRSWEEGELPPHIEIQVQHEMLVSGVDECDVVVMTGIYDMHIYPRKADPDMQIMLLNAVEGFWLDVENSKEPLPDYEKDGDVIAELFKPQGELKDFTSNETLDGIVSRFLLHQEEEKRHKAEKTAAKNELFYLLGDAAGGFTSTYRIKAGKTKDTAGKVVTADMVGQVQGARKGYRRCDITELNKGE